jgi:hypothetical protein
MKIPPLSPHQYILVGQTPVPEPDFTIWALWFDDLEHRRVKVQHVGLVRVSTVFLGIAPNFLEDPPRLFETMTFFANSNAILPYQTRCCTWMEAEGMHALAVVHARGQWKRPVEMGRAMVMALKDWMARWDELFYWRYGKRPPVEEWCAQTEQEHE